MSDIITYETLYEVLRKEKFNSNIQDLGGDFFKKVITYFEEKERLITSSPKDSAFSKEIANARKQLENAKKLMRELYERRESKILQLAVMSSRSGTKEEFPLLEEERKFLADAQATLDRYRREILENVLNTQHPQIQEAPKTIKTEKKEPINKLIRFVNPTPKFMSPDLKVHGPFEKEDIAWLPQKVAGALIKKKRAEEMKSEKK